MRPWYQSVSLLKPQQHVIDPTNPGGALDDSFEDRLHIRGRAADDAEHLGGCSLMLQGLTQFRVAFLDLLEQPHILDRDHCLVGKSCDQLDLALSKWRYSITPDRNCPDWTPLAKHGNSQKGARSEGRESIGGI